MRQRASSLVLRRHQVRCWEGAWGFKNRNLHILPDEDQGLTCNNLQPDMTCNPNGGSETSAQFTLKRPENAGSMVDVECL